MIAETVIEALIAETVHGFNENDECFSKSREAAPGACHLRNLGCDTRRNLPDMISYG